MRPDFVFVEDSGSSSEAEEGEEGGWVVGLRRRVEGAGVGVGRGLRRGLGVGGVEALGGVGGGAW